ncbi:MAG: hypothetical protein K6B28_11430, partial [Lachnospiraceae bacterium]|nr:hypothetical protein [Lachnospiraceae bacterium]
MKDQESRALSIIKDLTEYCKREYFEFYEALDVLIPRKVTRKKVREDKAVFNGGFFQDDDRGVFSTDGKYLLYDAELVNKNYKKNRYKSLVHHLMHVIMHLLLDDLQTYQNTANKRLYSAYADIRVEDILYILENPQNTQGEEISILDMHEVWKY